MNLRRAAAILFMIVSAGVMAFQIALAASAPWGSYAMVTNRMRRIQLDADLRELVAARPDTIKHVYELARIAEPEQRAPLIAAVRDEDLSRVATKERVDALLAGVPLGKSVFQETKRDILHKTNLSPPIHPEGEAGEAAVSAAARLACDMLTISRPPTIMARRGQPCSG